MGRRMTLEQFLDKAKKKFPDLDYSKVMNYVSNRQKIIVICKKHGECLTTPNTLLHPKTNHICGKCYREKNKSNIGIQYKNTEDFLDEVRRKWPDLPYSYEKVMYTKSHDYITITCKLHGDFRYLAYQLVGSGYICPKCNKEQSLVKKKNKIIEDWQFLYQQIVKRFPSISIDLSQLDFLNLTKRTSKIKILCSEHGIFESTYEQVKRFIDKNQSPCKMCRGLYINRNYSNNQFIDILKTIYKDKKYCYDETIYSGMNQKVKIICPYHGQFFRLPTRLFEGRGCPYCKESLLEREIRLFLESLQIDYIYQYRNKIILGKRSLDFYLPKYNAAIECQGKQHLSTDSKFSFDQTLEQIYNRDIEKRNMCLKAGIKLYYFSNFKVKNYIDKMYTDKNELLRVIIANAT